MTTQKQMSAVAILAIALAVGCSDNNEDDNNDNNGIIVNNQADMSSDQTSMDMTSDMQADQTEDMEEDIPVFGDMADDMKGDERRQIVIKEWPLNDKKAPAGSINVMDENGVYTVTIDATAGGSMAAKENAFVYVDLDEGKQVDITDLESLTDKTWELAFKRYIIRTNSGDSGDGDVELALIENTTFDAVTSAPTDAQAYATDETLDANNMVRVDPIGGLFTAFNVLNEFNPTGSQSWYNYNMGLSPTPGAVYIIRGTDGGKTFKMQILAWKSGEFQIQWTELK